MAVHILREASRCKLCRASKAFGRPEESEVNLLLEARSQRKKDEFGRQVNLGYVLGRYAELGIDNPTEDNVKSHLKHIEFIHDSVAAQNERDREQAEAQVRAELNQVSGADVADQIIDFELRVYLAERQIKAERGEIDALTADQIRGFIGEKTKRKHNDAQDELMRGLTGAVGAFVGKALGGSAAPAIEPPVVEGEVVGEEVVEVA